MKKLNFLFVLLVILFSCSNDDDSPKVSEESFLPMHIGNYWKLNDENFTEIVDTVRIQGDLYYEFYSLTGGDGVGTKYLRIDDQQNLIGTYPDNPEFTYIDAKFSADLGSTFWTIGDQSINDFKVNVIEKEKSSRAYEFQTVNQPNGDGKHIVKYTWGLGWDDYKEIKINGKLFSF